MKTSAAIQTVSAIMSPIGRQPTANTCLNEVFMPSAAIAATRHQRETSFRRSAAGSGMMPALLRPTSPAKPKRKKGNAAFRLGH